MKQFETIRKGKQVRTAHTQGIEWETLNEEVMSLYQKGQYDRAVVVAVKALDIAERPLVQTIPLWPRA